MLELVRGLEFLASATADYKNKGHGGLVRNLLPKGLDAGDPTLLKAHDMAKKSMIAKAKRTPKFKSRVVRRCFKCGRPRGYMRDFDLCRICFREQALEGNIPGVKKSSW